jgi:hypothetical protein
MRIRVMKSLTAQNVCRPESWAHFFEVQRYGRQDKGASDWDANGWQTSHGSSDLNANAIADRALRFKRQNGMEGTACTSQT